MKRKVGDKVIIKSIDWWDEQLKIMNADTYGVRDEKGFYFFVKEMTEYCSKKAFIEDVRERFYQISIDGRMIEYYWEDWMFEDNDLEFDYYDLTHENLSKFVWDGNGNVVDQNDKIAMILPSNSYDEYVVSKDVLFEASFPLQIRVPKEKEETSIYQFKSFDKVLVRNKCEEKWQCNFFSHYLSLKIGDKMENKYCCVYSEWKQCIPYEGNENLVGRTENPPYYGN